jgi:hypothetical protein
VSEFELWEKAALGTTGAAGAVMLLFKAMSFIKKEQAGQAGDGAIAAQFKALQDQITQCQADNKALHEDNKMLHREFNRMSTTIHKQQTKLTRMEMLLRQFSGLVQTNGTPVPVYMQDELDDLIVAESEKAALVGEELMSRRSTDK